MVKFCQKYQDNAILGQGQKNMPSFETKSKIVLKMLYFFPKPKYETRY